MNDSNRERDLVLAPNEYAFISDQTKGNINVYVGPYKTSLANTDRPVTFDAETKRFEKRLLEESIQNFIIAPEGWYVVLKNPAKDGNQPKTGTTNNLVELNIGRKVNIPGPIFFALWPGQMAKVIPGHDLRSNQYLLVRVYDEEEARKNWKKAVIKTKSNAEGGETSPDDVLGTGEIPELSIGKMLVIKGSNVSFYIPPTGIEVLRDELGNYVREAVTLERLEYCILLDENGNKRFIQGPAVVFPEPTEDFITKGGLRKFKAIELNEMSGLYIKVIAPYKEGEKEYKEGDELFITGKDQMIYYPRPEHALIKYGNKERHYSLAIPPGEGRYVLNRKTGKIFLVKGPAMFLPDPRELVLVRRILSPKQVQLWFPGNTEALAYNAKLAEMQKKDNNANDYLELPKIEEQQQQASAPSLSNVVEQKQQMRKKEATSKEVASDEFSRDSSYTPPRMLTLDTKYDGAVTIDLWTGYAVLVVSKTGTRKVVTGPQTYLLEYDENLEAVNLSTGTPKTEDNLLKTVYLRVLYNKVSDIVQAETSDFCQVTINLSYRVNFEGEPEKWFNVENYVKFLTDHMRSVIRNAVKKYTVMDFYAKGIDILRDVILGVASEGNKRPGRVFVENGMRIYDVEILDITLGDATIENLLISAQQDVVKQTLKLVAEQRRLEFTQQNEAIGRQIAATQSETKQKLLDLQKTETIKQLELDLSKIDATIQTEWKRINANLANQEVLGKIQEAELDRKKSEEQLLIQLDEQRLQQQLAQLRAEVEAVVSKAGAVSPDLIAALQAFGDKALAEKMAESMSPLAILGGKSIAEVFANLLKGTKLESVLRNTDIEDIDAE
jgi:major vault protein